MQALAFLWLLGLVWLNVIGWGLSALHQLNPAGYVVALLPGLAGALFWLKNNPPGKHFQKFIRRCRRPLPGLFVLATGLVFIGGSLYAPNNYDALSYRLPRMLNWLAAGTWHWIPTVNTRMNCAYVAWEWAGMPNIALAGSDRGMFLINAVGYLLMPGLLFSIFRNLGVSRKVAWTWMWLVPLAYGYVLQAGSIGNDLTGTICCLLSVFYGLQARHTGRVTDVWCAVLAAALMTGVKVTNLPLGLPCLIAVWPAIPRLARKWFPSLGVFAIALLISAAPTMVLNQLHTGDVSGDPENKNQMKLSSPAAGLLGNGLLIVQQSFMPPILPIPMAERVNELFQHQLPGPWQRLLTEKFPRYFSGKVTELPGEEGAGLGLAVTLPLLIGLVLTLPRLGRAGAGGWPGKSLFSVSFTAGVAFLAFVCKIGSEADARLLLPYYPLVIIPLLRLRVQENLLAFKSWRWLLWLGAASSLPVLVLTPSRPLWPAEQISAALVRQHPGNDTWQRMAAVYKIYGNRNDVLAPLREILPDGVRDLGFVGSLDDTDYSLWRPWGRHRIIWLNDGIHPGLQIPPHLEWVVIKQDVWPEISHQPLETWVAAHHGKIIARIPVTTQISWGQEIWCVVQLSPP